MKLGVSLAVGTTITAVSYKVIDTFSREDKTWNQKMNTLSGASTVLSSTTTTCIGQNHLDDYKLKNSYSYVESLTDEELAKLTEMIENKFELNENSQEAAKVMKRG